MREHTGIRLKKIMKTRKLKQVDVLKLTKPYCKKYSIKISKADISQYLACKYEPNQEKLIILSMALNVDAIWLSGFDVDISSEGENIEKTNTTETLFNDRLKEAIEKSGHTLVELQEITGISKSAIQRYASGDVDKLPIDRVKKIATATNVSPVWIMGYTENDFDLYDVDLLNKDGITKVQSYINDLLKIDSYRK